MAQRPVGEQLETILRLAFVAEFRDSDTSNHLRRISAVSRTLAEQAGARSEVARALELAAPMHDIGKVAIPDNILLKPGSLTAEERQIMQEHTIFGARLLQGAQSEILQYGERICRTHHERWDGGGYPLGLRGAEIPLEGRIVALADVYDALVTKRVYKPVVPHEEALETLRGESGIHFDPHLIEIFLKCHRTILGLYAELSDEDEEGQWVV